MVRIFFSFLSTALLLTTLTGVAIGEPILNVEAGLIGDDNINNGVGSEGEKSDLQEYVNVVFGQVFSAGADGSVTLAGNVEGHYFNRYEGLNNISPGLTLTYKTKLGLGRAPWLRLGGSVSRLDYRDDVRSGWLYHGDLNIEQALTRQWYLTAGFRFEKRTADHERLYEPDIAGDVFDQIGRILMCGINYWADDLTVFSLGYSWRRGDIAASLEESDSIEYSAKAVTEDKVFGDEFYAYKLSATTQLFSFGVGHEIHRDGMLNLKYQRRIAHADGDLNYYSSIVSINYQHHFL